jgi:hypothetical protein
MREKGKKEKKWWDPRFGGGSRGPPGIEVEKGKMVGPI